MSSSTVPTSSTRGCLGFKHCLGQRAGTGVSLLPNPPTRPKRVLCDCRLIHAVALSRKEPEWLRRSWRRWRSTRLHVGSLWAMGVGQLSRSTCQAHPRLPLETRRCRGWQVFVLPAEARARSMPANCPCGCSMCGLVRAARCQQWWACLSSSILSAMACHNMTRSGLHCPMEAMMSWTPVHPCMLCSCLQTCRCNRAWLLTTALLRLCLCRFTRRP